MKIFQYILKITYLLSIHAVYFFLLLSIPSAGLYAQTAGKNLPYDPEGLSVTDISASAIRLSWEKPLGIHGEDWDGVVILASDSLPIDSVLLNSDGVDYHGNVNFGNGTPFTHSFCIANQILNENGDILVTGLEPVTDYFFRAYSYRIVSGENNDVWSVGSSKVLTFTGRKTISDNFSDHDFSSSPVWYGDTSLFFIETGHVIPNGEAATDKSFLASRPNAGKISISIPSTMTDEWRFSLSTPDFTPSNKNYFGVILMSNSKPAGVFTDSIWNGYYLRFSNDSTISLYRKSGNTNIILGDFSTPSYSSEALTKGLNIKITRNSKGEFHLFFDEGFLYSQLPSMDGGIIRDSVYTVSSYFGFFQHFNNPDSSRRIYVDNVEIFDYCNTYSWKGSFNDDFRASSNWQPCRNDVLGSDKLLFNGGGNISISNMESQQTGGFVISGNTTVSLKAPPGEHKDITLFIRHTGVETTADISVESGSTLIFDVADVHDNAIALFLNGNAYATISGTVIFRDSHNHTNVIHRLLSDHAEAYIFNNGGTFIAENLNDNPFGETGAEHTVVFESGSVYEHRDGGNPFGLPQPASKVRFETGSVYIHQSADDPSFAGRTYGNFRFDYPDTLTIGFGSATAATGSIDNLTVARGTIRIPLNVNTQKLNLTIRGNLVIESGATFDFSPPSSGASVLAFAGSSASQMISGEGSFIAGENLTVKIANPNGVFLGKNLTLNGHLTFADNGKLWLGNHNLQVKGNILDADSMQYIITNSSCATASGYVIRKVEKGAVSVLFPIGISATSYTPCTIKNNTGETSDFKIKIFEKVYQYGISGETYETDHLVNRTWVITPDTTARVDIILSWSSADAGISFENHKARMCMNHGESGNNDWDYIPTSQYGASCQGRCSLMSTAVSDFSKFTVMDEKSPLPVTLAEFSAANNGITNIIRWATLSEKQNDFFTLERSEDAISFMDIIRIKGAGNSNTRKEYCVTDGNIHTGQFYYRIRQSDYNGQASFSHIISVVVLNQNTICYFQNTAGIMITGFPENMTDVLIELYDISGKQIVKFNSATSGSCLISKHYIPSSGLYFIRIVAPYFNLTKKVIVN